MLEPWLLEILVCPEDKGPLWYVAAEGLLYNPRLRRRYEVRDGIPDLLVDDATSVDPTEHERLASLEQQGKVVVTGGGAARPATGIEPGTAAKGAAGGEPGGPRAPGGGR